MEVPVFRTVRMFQASVSLLYNAWTDPDLIEKWWAPDGATATVRSATDGDFDHIIKLAFPANEDTGTEEATESIFYESHKFLQRLSPSRIVFISASTDQHGAVIANPFIPEWPKKLYSEISIIGRGKQECEFLLDWAPSEATEEECAAFKAGFSAMDMGWKENLDRLEDFLIKSYV